MIKFVNNSNNDSKETKKTPKGKNVKISSKEYTPPITNTISEIQAGESDQHMDSDDNRNDSMGWKNLPNMVIMSEDSDSSDTDGTE